ncbi:substrate-binding periplasmic protein [Nitrincola sp. MINF-07-Sa-05]|uniref:substrate-binding periplasmic protein n=1 Tax=Nitrincola salilacus TaxID=3400273 RepID=UPI0039183464
MLSALIRLLGSVLLILSANLQADELHITISTGEYAPFTTEQHEHYGLINQAITEAFRREGVVAEYQFLPWARALESVVVGGSDASSFWYYSPDLEKDYLLSDPIHEHREVFFHLKDLAVPNWQELSDLSHLTFGATQGYTYTPEFWSLGQRKLLHLQVISSDEQGLLMLMSRRIDMLPMDEVVGWQMFQEKLSEDELARVTISEKPLKASESYLVFSRANNDATDLLEKFNAGLRSIKSDGTFDAIFAR